MLYSNLSDIIVDLSHTWRDNLNVKSKFNLDMIDTISLDYIIMFTPIAGEKIILQDIIEEAYEEYTTETNDFVAFIINKNGHKIVLDNFLNKSLYVINYIKNILKLKTSCIGSMNLHQLEEILENCLIPRYETNHILSFKLKHLKILLVNSYLDFL